MKVAVDVMGSDHGPEEVIAGALKWCHETGHGIILVGDIQAVKEQLSKSEFDARLVEIAAATEVIGMHESPAIALRKKKDASIVIASGLVKAGKADAVLSCGSTGAQMAAAIFILGRMEGVERPPIIARFPSAKGQHTLIADVGANVDCRPKQLQQFAILGKTYASIISGNKDPRIALLSNGEEEGKGNAVTTETYDLLKTTENINFIGNIEGRDLLLGKSDVVICDGFVGNIVLKTLEGMAIFMAGAIRAEFGRIPAFFDQLDYTKIGGAPLLGINGISIVCHGSSKREAVYAGMKAAEECVANDIVNLQMQELYKSN